MFADAAGNLAAGTGLGVFGIVGYLVYVLVTRDRVANDRADKLVKAVEHRVAGAVAEAVRDSEARCDARLEAVHAQLNARLDLAVRGVQLLGARYPSDRSIQMLMVALGPVSEDASSGG